MRAVQFISAAALQACTFVAMAGDWPAGGSEKFNKECFAGASVQVPAKQALAYCECSNEMMREVFSTQQLAAIAGGKKPSEDEVSVLVDISRNCARETLK
ncbi:hypothetical protein [Metapseudomonas boanensis]|uniref:Lipoprotein n=2 Tax=Metapseudomonas boanensis TaxID=2822138 RepID=A0ABS5XC77_9GAMM|nr:hypothetical protein [Pseudomonas boanensis]MBT8765297.1 hypothetical protein [Pseudomonas boanensis]